MNNNLYNAYMQGLIGLDSIGQDEAVELLGCVATLSKDKQREFAQRMQVQAAAASNAGGSRGEMMKKLALLPKDVQQALFTKRAHMADVVFYWHKVAAAVTEKEMIEDADTKAAGVTNVNNGKLPKDWWFLCDGIILQSGVHATLSTTAFGDIADAIANGDFEFKADSKILVPQTSNEVFVRGTAEKGGLYKLDNPKLIEPEKDLRFKVRMSEATAATTNLRVAFKGSVVIPF